MVANHHYDRVIGLHRPSPKRTTSECYATSWRPSWHNIPMLCLPDSPFRLDTVSGFQNRPPMGSRPDGNCQGAFMRREQVNRPGPVQAKGHRGHPLGLVAIVVVIALAAREFNGNDPVWWIRTLP